MEEHGMNPSSTSVDYRGVVDELNSLLRLKTTIIGMKLYEKLEELDSIPKLRRPRQIHTADQVVGMAARLNWTVGVTANDLAGEQCGAVLGLAPQTSEWLSGKKYVGIWHATESDCHARQCALNVVPYGKFQAMAVSPISSGHVSAPDICLVYATPGQMILLINGLQWKNYRRFDWSVVGESSCADSWGRALLTGEPSLSIPCFAERRYGGVPDDEMLMAMPLSYLIQAVEGLQALSKNGIRYPIPSYGIQNDARSGMSFSYKSKG